MKASGANNIFGENKTLRNKVTISSIGSVARSSCFMHLNFTNFIFIRGAKYQAELHHRNNILILHDSTKSHCILRRCKSLFSVVHNSDPMNNWKTVEYVTTKLCYRKSVHASGKTEMPLA